MLVKVLADGDVAIGLFNFSDRSRELTLQFWDIGLPYAAGYSLSMYDCWTHENIGEYKERYSVTVDSCDCQILRAKLVK